MTLDFNKRRLFIALLLVGSLLLASGCKRNQNGPQQLTVGALLSYTGGAAAYGTETEKGALLAVDEINQGKYPFRIRYVKADDKSDKTEAMTAVRTLIDADGAQVILGPVISPSALSAGRIAEERRIPMVTPAAVQDEVTHSSEYNREYVSRICFDNSFQGKVLAQYAHHDLGMTSVATIVDKTLSYSSGAAKSFREEFERLGGKVKYEESYSVGDTDYSVLIAKVSRYDVDGLFIPGWDENVGPMLKQAGHAWDRFKLLGTESWPSDRFLQLAGGNIHQAWALSHYFPDDPDPLVREFNQKYHARYSAPPSAFAALGYDTMMLIADAAARSRSFKGPDLKDAINSTKNFRGVTGTITFDQFRDPQKSAVILRINPDGFSFVKRISPE
jgi:branched-chain amino acid transport system substrate-binding protein